MEASHNIPVQMRPEVLAVPAYRQGAVPVKPGFKLSSNENPFEPLRAVRQAISAAPANRYASQAMPQLRAKIGAKFGLTHEEAQSRVHLGAGSVSILYQLVQAAAGPGDEVLFAWPSFEGYPLLGLTSGATAKRVPLTGAFEHDLKAMASEVTPQTRVILLCTPNNPTGPAIRNQDFREFMSLVPRHTLVVLDEAYREFVTNADAVRGEEVLAEHPNLVVLRTFSKAYGLASLRIGYGVGHPAIWEAARVTGIPLSITAQAEAAAIASLENEPEATLKAQIDELIVRREKLAGGLRQLGFEVPDAQGNFVWLALGNEADRFAELFFNEGILVRPFSGEGVRITVGEEASISRVLDLANNFKNGEAGVTA